MILFDTGFCQFWNSKIVMTLSFSEAYHLTEVGAQIIMVPKLYQDHKGASPCSLCPSKAMEYQCYTVVSQIVGNAQWSMVNPCYGLLCIYSTPDIDFKGGIILKGLPQDVCGIIAELDLDTLTKIMISH